MARLTGTRDNSTAIAAAATWIEECLIQDGSIFSATPLWTSELVDEVYRAFVSHPDNSDNTFISKLQRQMANASDSSKQLLAEMLWALLLFPSNMKSSTKKHQIETVWSWGHQPLQTIALMTDAVLSGIGSGGPGFNTYRPNELAYLISCVQSLKTKGKDERSRILHHYDAFMDWIVKVPQEGHRQFRHMLRYFAFPDSVERIASNNDRQAILDSFNIAAIRETRDWTDRQLDEALLALRKSLSSKYPDAIVDFYEAPIKEQWSRDRTVKTPEGTVAVTVPDDDDELEVANLAVQNAGSELPRQSIQIQAALAKIGATMGFKVWVPRSDRARVSVLLPDRLHRALLDDLPLSYDVVTLDTIEQIDIIWLKGRSMARAFEVEHTTAIYSGLLRMADLLALQPNMDIRLHIVAPEERKEKVFREMRRPVFALLDRGPLNKSCTFISYDSVEVLQSIPHLAYTSDSIINEYEEKAEPVS